MGLIWAKENINKSSDCTRWTFVCSLHPALHAGYQRPCFVDVFQTRQQAKLTTCQDVTEALLIILHNNGVSL